MNARWTVFTALGFLLTAAPAWPQATMLQAGPWADGHAPAYNSDGTSQPVVQDSGPAGGGGSGTGLSEQAITSRSATNTFPSADSGTGPFASHSCMYDGPITSAAGYHFLCFDPNAQGGALISYGAGGVASALPLQFNVNGIAYPFTSILPGGSSGQVQYNNAGAFGAFTVTGDGTLNTSTGALTITKTGGVSFGPFATATTINAATQVSGLLPVANGGTGTATPGLISGTNVTVTGSWPNQTINAAGGSGGTPGGVSGQLQYNSSSSFGGFTLAGDCTITVPNVTCTKTSGTSFAPSATTDATNAANISSGTLPSGRLSGAYTGVTGVGTLTAGTWTATTIATGYGGTGLTTFTAANNAIYSTSSSALTAGTLPVAAGGTGSTTLTANSVLTGNGTSAVGAVAPSTTGNVLTSNGTNWTSAAPTGNTGAIGDYKNLKITTTSTTALTLSADRLTLLVTGGTAQVMTSVSVSISTGTTGAGGLDSGSVAPSTWYAVYAIGKPDGTQAGLLSTSSTSPTLPSGYTSAYRYGWVRVNGSSQLVALTQYGNRALWRQTSGGLPTITNAAQAAWTAFSMTSLGFAPSTTAQYLVSTLDVTTGAVYVASNNTPSSTTLSNFGTSTNGAYVTFVLQQGELVNENGNIYVSSNGGNYVFSQGWVDNL